MIGNSYYITRGQLWEVRVTRRLITAAIHSSNGLLLKMDGYQTYISSELHFMLCQAILLEGTSFVLT